MSASLPEKPSCTCILVPNWDNAYYQTLLRSYPTLATSLAHIPKQHAFLYTQSLWNGRIRSGARPPFDLKILLIANKQGKLTYLSTLAGSVSRLRGDIAASFGDTPAGVAPHPSTMRPTVNTTGMASLASWVTSGVKDCCPPSRDFKLCLRSCRGQLAWSAFLTLPGAMAEQPQHACPPLQLQQVTDFLVDWHSLAYTDGSCLTADGQANKLGSAIYIPAARAAGGQAGGGDAANDANASSGTMHGAQLIGGTCYSYQSAGSGPTNTINRAELIGIWQALQTPGVTAVATDSACALSQIYKCIMYPGTLLEHKHRDLLYDIKRLIAARPGLVSLYKVKSHIGIVGNEMADYNAKMAASGSPSHGSITCHAETRTGMYWLHTVSSGGTEATMTQVDDLGPALKHQLRKVHAFGSSDTTPTTFRRWQDKVVPVSCPDLSNGFMTLPGFTWMQRKHTLQYRTSTMFCGVWAKTIGKAASDRCRLCNMHADTCHHSVSGCPRLADLRTARHNRAGQIIVKAIQSGSLGACIVASDVGSPSPHHTADTPPRDIPSRFLPASVDRPPSRPDIVLSVPSTTPTARSQLLCVEIKYCQDFRPEEQRSRALSQHAETMVMLEQIAHTRNTDVTLFVFLLGVSGTIFRDAYDFMHTHLGMTKDNAKKTCKSLHKHSVVSLSSIYKSKRHMERSLAHAYGPSTYEPP
jgi:ribonuclease HI